jgi:hypothetical protein
VITAPGEDGQRKARRSGAKSRDEDGRKPRPKKPGERPGFELACPTETSNRINRHPGRATGMTVP